MNSPTRPTDGRQLPATLLAWIITAINVAVWIAMETAGGSTTGRVLVAFGAKVTPLIAQGEYWRLLTANFVHVGATHLLLNSVALLSFGRLTEMAFGHSRFLTIYLISGLAGVTASYLFTPGLSAGASAAIFGCAAALTVFFARNRRLAGAAGRAQLSGMLFILGANVVFGLVAPAIDQWGHLGGLVCGSILGFALAPRLVLVPGPEGEPPGIRKEPSPLFGWLIVPLMLIILGALVVGK